ncbi:hypothetical protein [Haliangium ochraceum]|uniref:Uncharacterized protein n=1 Tax=Haliangium ochraceum (strain DSM 14365 / JCM 11303 / SMP-2) TaxID=502025 RepID=D0LJU4_HALO1|nr:hypothetical protein [Haliangium ochraceum]ACY18451.1 hypothetical protein Hoch_5976 [Haliangium ochraceum DSM 14365]
MDNFQQQVSHRVDAFVSDITELARAAAYEALNSALEARGVETSAPTTRPRRGGKRTAEELQNMADTFFEYVSEHPGQRMEQISKALGFSTSELSLPVKKLLASKKIQLEGQKRATQYYAAGDPNAPAKSGSRRKSKRRASKTVKRKAAKRSR